MDATLHVKHNDWQFLQKGSYDFNIDELEYNPAERIVKVIGQCSTLSRGLNCGLIRDDLVKVFGETTRPNKIKRVIFNDPVTIIKWKDGTKTVVKCQPGDVYDKEKGFVMAYLKKLLGNDNTFNKEISKYVPLS